MGDPFLCTDSICTFTFIYSKVVHLSQTKDVENIGLPVTYHVLSNLIK